MHAGDVHRGEVGQRYGDDEEKNKGGEEEEDGRYAEGARHGGDDVVVVVENGVEEKERGKTRGEQTMLSWFLL